MLLERCKKILFIYVVMWNKLKLNISETKFVILTRNRVNRDEYELIRNDAILRANVIKYLGTMIDYRLSFDDHLKHIVTKISRKIGIMIRSIKLVNKNYKTKVYNSIILPNFVYCSSILFVLNTTQMDKLQKLRNRVMRIVV